MSQFKLILVALTQKELNKIAILYEGFCSFLQLLGALSEGIKSGEINP